MPDDLLPLIDPDEEKIHRLYRERIVQEDNLINHRMMWMVLSQAFMLALWGVVFNVSRNRQIEDRIILDAIATIGALLALSGKMSIRAAQLEIENLKKKYSDLYENPASAIRIERKCREQNILPSLTAERHFHWLGHLTPNYMPLMLIFLWLVLIATVTIGLLQGH